MAISIIRGHAWHFRLFELIRMLTAIIHLDLILSHIP